jgi:hypothetical protein
VIVWGVGAFLVTFIAIGYLYGDFESARDLIGAVLIAALVGVGVAWWLHLGERRGAGAGDVFDERATRRAVRRGVIRTALVAVVWVVAAGIVLNFTSLAWQSRGDRPEHFEHVARYGFLAANPGFRTSSWGCCNTGLRSIKLLIDAEPRVASAVAQSVDVELKLDHSGHLEDPALDLPQTGVDAALASPPATKRAVRRALDGLPDSVVVTAIVELRSPTGVGRFFDLLARNGVVYPNTDVPVFLQPGAERERRRHAGTFPDRRVSWPNPNVAQFQAWVKKLRNGDDRLLDDLSLPPTRVLRGVAAEPRIHGFVLDRASPQRLQRFLEDPAIKGIQPGDAAFNVSEVP